MNRIFPEDNQPRASAPSYQGYPQAAVNGQPAPASAGLNLGDIYYTLFRHKWKIILCAVGGVVAAGAFRHFNPPPFESEAKLFVRYIISENKAMGPTTHDSTAKSPDQRGETIMKSEAEILSSLDLARQVAEAVGPEKILAPLGGGKDLNSALGALNANLTVTVAPASSVIHILFKHPDPDLVQPVLRELIDRYLKLHVETHTANGMLGDFLTQETDQLRARLSQTEDELRKATLKAGIISLEDAKKSYSEQLTAIRRDLFTAHAELAQRTAVLEELNRRFPQDPAAEDAESAIPADIIGQYQNASQQIQSLQAKEREALTQFKAESDHVKEIRTLLEGALATRDSLQAKYPKLAQLSLANQHGNESLTIDPTTVATQITALQAKIKTLTKQLDDVRADAAKVDQMEGTIVELRRKKELEEANYRYYSASLEQSRINETLGNGRVANIIRIQAPSPPFADQSKTNKTVGLLLAGGLLAGVLWAFLIELYLDRSIRRPIDVERMLRAPLLLAIPALKPKLLKAAPPMLKSSPTTNGHDANGANGHATANGHALDAAPQHPLQPFHETLRDRIIGYFESMDLRHKPKLVALTGLGHGAGVSTTAAGLARSLSETGEGNVLLVDMNVGHGFAQQYTKGKEACGLDDVLSARENAHVDEKLYVVTENNSDRLSRNIPQRFSKLLPKLKASDFDYIIFDLPPVSQISITPRLAGFMDMVVLVVESGKNDRELVQRATALLADSRAPVGVVLNKTRRYVPARLHEDSLGNS